uniref:Secreted protein n=1 Tax=Myotis myotis TaxID=51298 RepID=A0A7J7VID6_MYOMY|nr:hypothetical protein mMyoMyo1_008372 [Myotis myotis]
MSRFLWALPLPLPLQTSLSGNRPATWCARDPWRMRLHRAGGWVSVSRAHWLAWPTGLGAQPPPINAWSPIDRDSGISCSNLLLLSSYACRALITPVWTSTTWYQLVCRFHLSCGHPQLIFLKFNPY